MRGQLRISGFAGMLLACLLACACACACACAPAPRGATTPALPGSEQGPARAEPSDGRLAWFEDDPAAAFTAARAQKQLLFADLWAPWCHTCLSMRQLVLTSRAVPELTQVAALAIDTERAANEQFLREFPVAVWPTFYLIDPATREVKGRWLGGASPAQLSRWLQDSARADDGPLLLLREADALAAKKRFAEAEARYRAALAAATPGWQRRPETLVALLSTLSKQRNYAGCLQLALEQISSLPPSVSAVDFASLGFGCSEQAKQEGAAEPVRRLVEAVFSRNCDTAAPGASPDDQADACGNLRNVREKLGDRAGARRAAEQALAAIAAASAGAPHETQLIYDWERTASLVYLGRAQEALTLLLERERALPSRYNPPHYLARVYRERKQWQLGLAAIDRALDKAYGPRHAGLLGLKADLLQGAGRAEEAQRVLQQQLAEYQALPPGQRQPDAQTAVEKRLLDP